VRERERERQTGIHRDLGRQKETSTQRGTEKVMQRMLGQGVDGKIQIGRVAE